MAHRLNLTVNSATNRKPKGKASNRNRGTSTEPIPTLHQKMSETKSSIVPKPTDRLQALPTFMQRQILAFFGYQDYTLTSRACHFLLARWKEAMKHQRITGTLFVPGTCQTLTQAVNKVHGGCCLTPIVVGQGEHQIGEYLKISSATNIVGDPRVAKEKIVVVGGVLFIKGIHGNCHLQHLTLRSKGSGVFGRSSFTMADVVVEQCGHYGVSAVGTGVVGRCTNLEVRQCGGSGVRARTGASITLIGAKTTVHHNCTKRDTHEYGLQVFGSPSTIQLVSPLTKEQVALENGGGGNWGAEDGGDINQIKTSGGEAARSRTKHRCICV